LTGGKSIEKSARDLGASSERDVRWWGHLLRRCLDVLAKALGFANSAERPRRIHPFNDGPNPTDSRLHADAGDLSDARLRSGRPNGGC